jgi:hypothetical protein
VPGRPACGPLSSIAGVANFGDLQNEIYLAGLSGVLPSLPMSFAELERRAELALPPGTWSYVAGGAGLHVSFVASGV